MQNVRERGPRETDVCAQRADEFTILFCSVGRHLLWVAQLVRLPGELLLQLESPDEQTGSLSRMAFINVCYVTIVKH